MPPELHLKPKKDTASSILFVKPFFKKNGIQSEDIPVSPLFFCLDHFGGLFSKNTACFATYMMYSASLASLK
jgi:hypothetical protein